MDSMDPERVTVEYSSKMNPSLLLASRHVVALSHVPNSPEPPNQAHLLRTDTICIMLSDLLYYFFLSYSLVILFYRSSRILIVSIYVCSRRYWGYRHRYTQQPPGGNGCRLAIDFRYPLPIWQRLLHRELATTPLCRPRSQRRWSLFSNLVLPEALNSEAYGGDLPSPTAAILSVCPGDISIYFLVLLITHIYMYITFY